MKLKFTVETHRDEENNWFAQVLLNGQVIHQQDGPVSEGQAINNVTSSFASLLTGLLYQEQDRQMAEAEG